jgi:nicotinamidase/pyrazinamidase
MAWCKRSGPITACRTAKARRCIRCCSNRRLPRCFIKGKPGYRQLQRFFDNGHRQKTALDEWLRQRGITDLIIVGLATDYCVKFTVLDALDLGYTVNVITDGCRGVNLQAQDSAHAFMAMAAAGATLYTLDDWLETQA